MASSLHKLKPYAPLARHLDTDRFFRAMVDSVTDYAIFVLDPDGNVASWNPGAERMKGYTRDEIVGQHFSVFYPEKDKQAAKPQHELEVAARVGRYEDEGWRIRKDGTRFWANVIITRLDDENGALLGFGKITRDLSERRVAEQRYRLLVEGVTDYAIFSLDHEGYVRSWNSGAQRIKGYTADEIIGQHFSKFYPPEDVEKRLPWKVLATAAENGHFEGEGWRVRKDGTRFWSSVVVTAIRDEEGTLTGFSKVTRDVTERKRLMDALQKHSDELEVQIAEREQVNAELEAFAYSVSHDLRAPLRAITGFAEALREDCAAQLDDRGRDYLKEITSAAARMNSLVQDLLDYGRVSRIDIPLAAVNLQATIKEAVRQMGDGVRGSLKIDVADALIVQAHPQVLTQIILNLLSNAFKFHAKDSVPDVHIFAEGRDGTVRVSVRDNGIGIAPQHQDRIWNVFERLHDRDTYAGTGIGLAIVKRGITRMAGAYGVESDTGKGSTFWIELPRAPSNDKAAQA